MQKQRSSEVHDVSQALQEMFEPVAFRGREDHSTLVRGSGHLLTALPTQSHRSFFFLKKKNNRDKQGGDLTVACMARNDWSQLCGPRPTRSGFFISHLLQSLWGTCLLTH